VQKKNQHEYLRIEKKDGKFCQLKRNEGWTNEKDVLSGLLVGGF